VVSDTEVVDLGGKQLYDLGMVNVGLWFLST